jgi:DNA gyrase subunit A
MASNVCSFNISEICDTTVSLIKNPEHDIISTLKGPDFSGGGFIIYDEAELQKVYDTGRGSIKVRSKYNFDKDAGCIEITEIPPTTTVEAIMDKIVEHIKSGKIKEISYIRDETDISGLKLAIDIKRGVDPDKLMQKLYRMTPLQDSYPCNFNILIGGTPRVMGVREILEEWTAFRKECVKRRVYFDLAKKKGKLHLLKGLEKILLDIDKAIKIVRETEEEADVVPNLMIGFGIDEIQAEYVAEIKLRHLNKEYILKRTGEIEQLEKDIAEMQDILANEKKIGKIIISELEDVKKKYGQPRKTQFIYAGDIEEESVEEEVPDYPVNLFLTKSGYFKKITPLSLRMGGEQKFKEGDTMAFSIETTNRADILFFSDKSQVYKAKASQFQDTKASNLGEFIPAKLGFDEGENLASMAVTLDYSETLLFFFENGKVAKVPINAYETKLNRKKLSNAYSDKNPLVKMIEIKDNTDILIKSTSGKALVFNSGMILPKTTKNTIGVAVMTLKSKSKVESAYIVTEELAPDVEKYRAKNIPAAGSYARDLEDYEQLTF